MCQVFEVFRDIYIYIYGDPSLSSDGIYLNDCLESFSSRRTSACLALSGHMGASMQITYGRSRMLTP